MNTNFFTTEFIRRRYELWRTVADHRDFQTRINTDGHCFSPRRKKGTRRIIRHGFALFVSTSYSTNNFRVQSKGFAQSELLCQPLCFVHGLKIAF
ncbi:MAG: hypothetical protein ABR969_09555, partial [Sedimentisphaerales bacterium]